MKGGTRPLQGMTSPRDLEFCSESRSGDEKLGDVASKLWAVKAERSQDRVVFLLLCGELEAFGVLIIWDCGGVERNYVQRAGQ